jgi:membrane protein
VIFSYFFRIYVRYCGNYDTAYGSLGGIMVLLFWYWVVGMVLLGAAEMDREIEARSGPDDGVRSNEVQAVETSTARIERSS